MPRFVMGITPYQNITDRMFCQDRCEGVRPPVFCLYSLIAGLCKSHRFMMFFSCLTNYAKRLVEIGSILRYSCGITIRSKAILVVTDNINQVIAGITLHQRFFCLLIHDIGGISI